MSPRVDQIRRYAEEPGYRSLLIPDDAVYMLAMYDIAEGAHRRVSDALDRAISEGHRLVNGAGCTCLARADENGIAEDDPRSDEEIVSSWFAAHVAAQRVRLLGNDKEAGE